ncbi:MAG: dTDP-4-dehydrorhamnose 3,5-epimerase [Bacteroidia bacterium]|nr:dTDP-4-dehydrorhamnose 3,5-epimerase [Bacteroidia bacterium]NNJ56462.1 dTDP-4-dehydrorhamnose 3,5-epimerase [Bacteroidia bacterium]
MKVIQTGIKDLLVLEPQVFGDHRGYFFESFRKDVLGEAGVNLEFIQDNQSMSKKNILRGLHFQEPPYEQGKLVRVLSGAVIDVVVDIRKDSETYGQHFKIELNEENKLMLWVPPGFAHGFLTLQDDTIFVYKCTQYYNKDSEGCVRWNSPKLNIDWGINNPILSDKDKVALVFDDFESPF